MGVCRTNVEGSWEILPFEVFFICLCDVLLWVTYANMLVTTQWPLKYAAHLTSPHVSGCVWYGGLRYEIHLINPTMRDFVTEIRTSAYFLLQIGKLWDYGTRALWEFGPLLIDTCNSCTSREKIRWLPTGKRPLQLHFLIWKLLWFDSNFTEICSLGSN